MQQNNIRWRIGVYGSNKSKQQTFCHLILTLKGRPIPKEMFDYARSDTHFLLYIYDNMRNELIDKSDTNQEGADLIELVMDRSKEEALQCYERPFYDINHGSGQMGWYNMLCRTPALFNKEQFAVFRAVHQWRDNTAREEDESVHVIMPKHVLYNLAREMPVDMPSLLRFSHPISQSIKNRKSEILAIIQKARMPSLNGPELKEIMHTRQPITAARSSEAQGAERVVPAPAIAKTAVPPRLQRYSTRVPAQTKDSRFWGSTVPDNMDQGAIAQMPRENFRLALPMPRLSAEIYEDTEATGADANKRPQTNPGACAEHRYMKDRKPEADDVITIQEAGGHRKRNATESYNHPSTVYRRAESNAADHAQEHSDKFDNPPTVEYQEQQDQNRTVSGETKEEKRARRLESKRLKTETLRGKQDVKSQRPRDIELFDYASVPSVLHAQRDSSRMIAGTGINPYTKSSNAPKGMRKAKKEQEGRSFTFKG